MNRFLESVTVLSHITIDTHFQNAMPATAPAPSSAAALVCACVDEVARALLTIAEEELELTGDGLQRFQASHDDEEDTCMSYEEEDTCLQRLRPLPHPHRPQCAM